MEEGKKEGIKQGIEQGIKEGKKEGIKEGKKEGKLEGKLEERRIIALNMKSLGIPSDKIQIATGLSDKEINEL